MKTLHFIKYDLSSEMLCLGERIKNSIFRPSCRLIRFSQITGALRAKFGYEFYAVGSIKDKERLQSAIIPFTTRDRYSDGTKAPMKFEVLTNVQGDIYIVRHVCYRLSDPEQQIEFDFPDTFEIIMGAFSMKGIGKCELSNKQEITISEDDFCYGHLNTRIPLKVWHRIDTKMCPSEVHVPRSFGIDIESDKTVPAYGYLYNRLSEKENDGIYVKSLFEGSKVQAPSFLVE